MTKKYANKNTNFFLLNGGNYKIIIVFKGAMAHLVEG